MAASNQVYVVGIIHSDDRDYNIKADILREALLQYDFVMDVMDWEEESEDKP